MKTRKAIEPSGYEWRAIGERIVSSYAAERITMGENAGTTVADCFSEKHAREIVHRYNVHHDLLEALRACEDRLSRSSNAVDWPAIELARAAIAKATQSAQS